MDKKIGFLTAISVAVIMTSGCSSFRGSNQGAYGSDSYSSGGSSQVAGSGQVSGGGQVARGGQVANNDSVGNGRKSRLFGQQYRNTAPATCKPCATATPKAQNTYTYRPAPTPKPKTVYRPPAKTTGQHSQQWYVDRWKRQQQQGKRPRPAATNNTSTYSGYGSGNYDAGSQGSSTYYDYSSAGGTKNTKTNTTSAATSNKSIYTGSYQQKTYKPYNPTTYAGGSTATTNTTTTVVNSGGGAGSTYTVKKGDTVFEIMRQTGVYWKDIISLNNLQPPYNISPGQTIRLK